MLLSVTALPVPAFLLANTPRASAVTFTTSPASTLLANTTPALVPPSYSLLLAVAVTFKRRLVMVCVPTTVMLLKLTPTLLRLL